MVHPKELSQFLIWFNIYKSSITSEFLDPIGKEKRPGRFFITNKIEEKFPRYLWKLYQHAVIVRTNEVSFQENTKAMMEKLREEGKSRESI